jgi:branched-chain amino acid transport system ATP-binding protein
MVAEPLLEVRGLTKSFGGVQALAGANFTLPHGSLTGLVGPNGSGKSTAIDCITGFQKPDAGEIVLADWRLTGLAPHACARRGVRRTFQAPRTYRGATVLEYLLIAHQEFAGATWLDAWLRTGRFRAVEEASRVRAATVLSDVGLDGLADSRADELSYGQQKLLALAGSLMSAPRLLCLDEPLAGVNPSLINDIADVVSHLHQAGQAFLIVEHNVEFIARIADQVVVMADGRVVAQGEAGILWSDDSIFEAFLGGVRV